jgi:hypothetical protein
MIQQIRNIHEKFNEFGEPYPLKIVQIIDNERKIIYTEKMRKFWSENLVV